MWRLGSLELCLPLQNLSILPSATLREDPLATGRTIDVATVLITFHHHENSPAAPWDTPAYSHLNLKVLQSSPEDLLKQEAAKTTPGTNGQPDSSKWFVSLCSYLMSNRHDFPRLELGDEQCSGGYVLSSCLFNIPVDRTLDAGPDGARHIIQMSGKSPGVLSRGRRQRKLSISSLECIRKNIQWRSVFSWEPEWLMFKIDSEMPISLRAQEKWIRTS